MYVYVISVQDDACAFYCLMMFNKVEFPEVSKIIETADHPSC